METILDGPAHSSTYSSYAGFWIRFIATVIDSFILSIIFGAAAVLIIFNQSITMIMAVYTVALVGGWLYFAMMESSEKQGTLGKLAVGLKVTNIDGARISFANATGRFFGKWISGMILYIGYIMAGFTEKKQALHDIMAGTLVVRK